MPTEIMLLWLLANGRFQEHTTEDEREAYIEYMESMDVREQEAEEIIRGYFVGTYYKLEERVRHINQLVSVGVFSEQICMCQMEQLYCLDNKRK